MLQGEPDEIDEANEATETEDRPAQQPASWDWEARTNKTLHRNLNTPNPALTNLLAQRIASCFENFVLLRPI